jgi:parallel beta-helix repeat protein
MKKFALFRWVILVVAVALAITRPVSASAWGGTLEVGLDKPYQTIQDAVADARWGDTVLVYEGYYEESVLVTTDNLKIIAVDEGVTVFSPNGGTAAFTVYANRVTIRGFDELTGIMDCVPGIQFEGSYNTFADNTINPGSCPGVNALVCRDDDGGSNYNRIENNTIMHADLGIVMTSVTTDALNIGNIIRNNTLNHISATGIVVENGLGFDISGNTIPESVTGHCISVIADNDTPQGHHRITNNEISHCSEYGIALWADNSTTLSHNRIDKNEVSFSTTGINLYADPDATVSRTLIQDNTVYHNYVNGITLEAGASSNVLSANYVVTNTNDGIQVVGDHNKIIQNTSLGNGIWDLADEGTGNIWLGNEYDTASWE